MFVQHLYTCRVSTRCTHWICRVLQIQILTVVWRVCHLVAAVDCFCRLVAWVRDFFFSFSFFFHFLSSPNSPPHRPLLIDNRTTTIEYKIVIARPNKLWKLCPTAQRCKWTSAQVDSQNFIYIYICIYIGVYSDIILHCRFVVG